MAHVRILRFGLAALIIALWAVAVHGASPGSTPSGSAGAGLPELPDMDLDSRLPSDRFEFIKRDSSVGGVVGGMPAPTTSSMPDAAAMDQIERRRNWIYYAQPPSTFELSAEQALGVRQKDTTGWSGEASGGLADFFYDRGKSEKAVDQNRLLDDLLAKPLDSARWVDPTLGSLNSDLGFAGQRTQRGPGAMGNGLIGLESPAMGIDPASPVANEELSRIRSRFSSVPSSVRELLASPDSINPLVGGFDPINLRVDTTRQELNPTMPQRLPNYSTAPKTAEALLEADQRSVSSGRPGLLDSFNARMLGSSSLAPAVAPPPAEVRTAERPLEFGQFPTRKF